MRLKWVTVMIVLIQNKSIHLYYLKLNRVQKSTMSLTRYRCHRNTPPVKRFTIFLNIDGQITKSNLHREILVVNPELTHQIYHKILSKLRSLKRLERCQSFRQNTSRVFSI